MLKSSFFTKINWFGVVGIGLCLVSTTLSLWIIYQIIEWLLS